MARVQYKLKRLFEQSLKEELMSSLSTTSAASPPASAARLADQSTVARHWIDGEWASSDAVSESINPATGEDGKKLAEGMFESTTADATLRHAAAQALTDTGISAEVAPGQWFSTYAEPAGVVAIIVPWNAPVSLFIRSLAPALTAGTRSRSRCRARPRWSQIASRRSSPRSNRWRAAS
jgi:acyl-CoA reductase-like NAD-dependent aldehyde dehydrogenase